MTRQGGAVNQSKIPALISSVVVLVVLGIAALMLFNRSGEPEAAQDEGPTPTAESAALATIISEEQDDLATDVPAATPADPAAPTLPTPYVPSAGEVIEGRPPFNIDPAQDYTATITTPRGDIVIRLLPELAPQTVNNFVYLARQGFYDGLTWHRVIEDFMAQGGDPTGTGTGGAEWNVPAEFTSSMLYDRPGLVAMARSSDPDSASSQFFITTAPAPWLNYQYTIFGEVIEGQEIVNTIPLRDPMSATEPGEEIVSITITEGEGEGDTETDSDTPES
jgi:peptidylprolyl isomerase